MTRSRQRVYASGGVLCLAFAMAMLLVAGNLAPGTDSARLATAQVARPEGAENYSRNVFLPPDRSTLRNLSQSRLLIEEGRYGEAVRFLGNILEEPEDYFFSPKESSPVFRSLKSEAERLIGRLPRRGRDLYELQYGAQAQRMLTDALASGDVARLAKVSRRFFHTRSGYQATFLLGLHHFDHGRPLAGAMVLQRLHEVDSPVEELEPGLSLSLASCWLQAGMPERARESLTSLRRRDPTLRVTVAGREVPLFADDSEAVAWLTGLIGAWSAPEREIPDDWLMFRGNSSRNASANGGSPLLNTRWRVSAADDPLTESALEQCRNIFSEHGLPIVPMLHPLAIGDVLLMRTARNLLAVDFATGKRLWEVPFEEPVELASAGNVQQLQAALALAAGQRMWGDLTYGTLSSDGRHVFSVEDLGSESGGDSPVVQRIGVQGGIQGGLAVVVRIQAETKMSPCNRLTAHDIRTGKLVWELGGLDGPRALRQAKSFFLGPPLPLMGRLYVLAETKEGDIRLLALDPATGDLFWTQQLSLVEQSVLDNPRRRWVGVSPSYADGVLVCPTSTGAVVGVELATGSLLWGFCYERDNNGGRNVRARSHLSGPAADNWIDGGVSIRDGHVLITPQDSNRLYCLNLIDGELQWKSQRENDLYVACVDREKVVLVGRDAVRALRLDDGEPAWEGRTVSLPEGSTPSGRGFLSGDQYFLPLSSAEVAAIDLAAGRIDNISKSRDGTVPGNLVCHKGIIVSQGVQGVDTYFQLDLASAEVDRRLKVNPNDAWALSLRGEILLNADRRSEAIASFRHAYDLALDPRTRELLRDSLLEGLRSEFAAYRGCGVEIEPLLDSPPQQAMYLRLMASGLRGEGEWAKACDHYLKLANLEPNRQPLDQVDDGLVVRRDRWIQGQLAELRKEAKGEAAEKIDQIVSARLETALAADSIDPLRRFLDYFGGMPVADAAHDELIRRLKSEGQRLEVELASPPAEKPADRNAAKSDADWPTGNVEVATAPTKNPAGFHNRYTPVELRGSPGPFFRDLSIKFHNSRREIVAFDGLGREKWKVSLVKKGRTIRHRMPHYYTMYARAVGHLLLVALGWNVYAIDTLGLEPDGAPRLLWVQDLSNPSLVSADLPDLRQVIPLAALPPQLRQQFAPTHQDQSNLLGAANRHYVCLRRFHDVVAVDPRNGETLWVRRDLPAACNVFGDDQHLFVLSTDREEATLLCADDGASLGTRKVPRRSSQRKLPNGQMQKFYTNLKSTCLATLGRKLLLWWPEGTQRELTLIDPLEGRDEWPRRKFHYSSRTSVVDDEAVGVLEPDGRFVLISLPDGRTLADVKLDSEPNLLNITLFKSGEQFFLLTNYRLKSGKMSPIQPMPNQRHRSSSPINQGRLYAFDLQGKLLWPGPVKVEKQLLFSDQPAALPVVIFGCQHYERKPNGRGQWKPRVSCFDKRSGRRVYKGEFDNHMGIFNVACDTEKKTVALTMQKETVTLTYTDDPIPPPSAADADPTESPPGSKVTHALWNSIRKAIVPINPFGDED